MDLGRIAGAGACLPLARVLPVRWCRARGILASCGIHGLSHRAVEVVAGLPAGTASNYFRSREALLIAAAERIAELQYAETRRAAQQHGRAPAPQDGDSADSLAEQAADLIAGSLIAAATVHRERHLAVLELLLEARRQPPLAAALADMQEEAARFTSELHARLGLPIPGRALPVLLGLYEGALFALLTAQSPETIEHSARVLAHALFHGAVSGWPAPDCPWR